MGLPISLQLLEHRCSHLLWASLGSRSEGWLTQASADRSSPRAAARTRIVWFCISSQFVGNVFIFCIRPVAFFCLSWFFFFHVYARTELTEIKDTWLSDWSCDGHFQTPLVLRSLLNGQLGGVWVSALCFLWATIKNQFRWEFSAQLDL